MRLIKEAKESQLLLVWWNNERFVRVYTYESLTRKIPDIHARIRSELLAEGMGEARAEELADEAIAELASNAMPVEPDKQGRIVLPKQWMEKLGLSGSVMIRGRYSYISIGRAMEEEKAPESATAGPTGNAALKAKVTAQLNKW
ncbi:MAG: division/cell wall cluster transcriptional repressor MraZ [Planctomycetota bacterium]|nr:division/cell wall cluster transcriptional repressor MraZ [Planctomycetota bacterium]